MFFPFIIIRFTLYHCIFKWCICVSVCMLCTSAATTKLLFNKICGPMHGQFASSQSRNIRCGLHTFGSSCARTHYAAIFIQHPIKPNGTQAHIIFIYVACVWYEYCPQRIGVYCIQVQSSLLAHFAKIHAQPLWHRPGNEHCILGPSSFHFSAQRCCHTCGACHRSCWPHRAYAQNE